MDEEKVGGGREGGRGWRGGWLERREGGKGTD
jgi:hypothetical protein